MFEVTFDGLVLSAFLSLSMSPPTAKRAKTDIPERRTSPRKTPQKLNL